jgi:Flp pilus assembly protein CpaB
VKRQTIILVAIGIVLFIAGGGIAFVSVVNGNKNKTPTTVSAVNTPVVVATADIPVGTTGQQMQSEGLVTIQPVAAKNYVATDLTNLASLNDFVLTTPVAKGHAILTTQLTASTSALSVPAGYDVVTITVSGVNGLAGYLQPGSRVDVYANITKLSTVPVSETNTIPVPCTELAMTNIEVLDVSSTAPALAKSAVGGRSIPSSETLALAVTPAQSQTVSFLTTNESLSVVQTQKNTLPPTIGICNGTGQYVVAP